MNPFDMRGRRYLVTGASSGIGRETAILLSNLGAQLVIAGRNKARLEETRCALKGDGHKKEPFDFSSGSDIPAWIKEIAVNFGPLDGLVHAAGVQSMLPLKLIESRDVETMLWLNIGSAVMLAKGYRQRNVHAARGSMVFLSSASGLVGEAGLSLYSASKGAIVALVKSLAMELSREKIRVNCVAPSYVQTPMLDAAKKLMGQEQFERLEAAHPLGIGNPLDVGYAIAYLLADTSAWVTGTTLVVDGGFTAR